MFLSGAPRAERLEQQVASLDHNLGELSRTVTRLKEQLRNLEIETEKQILHRYEGESAHRGDFDPLELDRYSSIQQFSRALAETASDVASIQQLLETQTQDTQNLLQQQARVVTELQNGLMRTRMVPFQRNVQRLTRLVRQAANDTGKKAELSVEGAAAELDRQVLERMVPPLEHMLRNAVVHGIETPAKRIAAGKPETGTINLNAYHEGGHIIIEIADDGRGLNVEKIKAKALSSGLTTESELETMPEQQIYQFIFKAGFSTAAQVTAVSPKRLTGVLRLPTWLFRILARRMLKIDPEARSSMADDVDRGRPTEVDAICGAVVRLAQAHRTKAPLNARMVLMLSGGVQRRSGRRLRHDLGV